MSGTVATAVAAALPGLIGTVIFGVMWLHEVRARDVAEAERDRLWDETHGVTREVT